MKEYDFINLKSDESITDGFFPTLNKGSSYPLLFWRYDQCTQKAKEIFNDGTIRGVSHIRSCHIDNNKYNIFDILLMEIDLAIYVSEYCVKDVFAVQNGNAINAILRCSNDVLITLEVGSTILSNDKIERHEIISSEGNIMDLPVDTLIKQSPLYLFGEQVLQFDDTDISLFGLSRKQRDIVYAYRDYSSFNHKLFDHSMQVLNAVKKSISANALVEVENE